MAAPFPMPSSPPMLYYMNDVPLKTIAKILDKNLNTVKVTLFRARENLRTYFED